MALRNQPTPSNNQNSSHQWVTLSKNAFLVEAGSNTYDAGTRACDKCRVRKRKCDFGQPNCAECQTRNLPCTYTPHKRKPGPSKGTLHYSRKKHSLEHNGPGHTNSLSQSTASNDLPAATSSMTPNSFAREPSQNLCPEEQPRLSSDHQRGGIDQNKWPNIQILTFLEPDKITTGQISAIPSLSNELEIHLFDLYFEYIQPMYPLFQRKALLEHHVDGSLPRSLKMIMFALAARYSLRQSEISNNLGVKEICASFAAESESAHHVDLKSAGNNFTLAQVQTAFLSCIYDITLSLDRKAWVQVGQLTQIAHICGLDKTEGGESCIFHQPGITKMVEMEELRHLWWNIWRLDATANSVNSSPCSTDMYVPGTALISTSIACFTDGSITDSAGPAFGKLYLEGEVSTCWKAMQAFLENSAGSELNMYTAAFTLIRETSAIQRLTRFKWTSQSEARLLDLDKACAAVQLALPPWYSNPARSISTGESTSRHFDRLKVLLIILCARNMAALCAARVALAARNLVTFRDKWQSCLSSSQQIIDVVQHFDPEYFWKLDPITGFIPWLAGVQFSLEIIASSHLDEWTKHSLLSNVDLTILFLRQIGSLWNVGLVLSGSLENLIENRHKYNKASYEDLLPLLSQLEMPLNQKTRSRGSWPAYATPADTADPSEAIDPLSFLTFENPGYDMQMFLGDNLGLDNFPYG